MSRKLRYRQVVPLLVAGAAFAGCNWVDLTRNALTYRTIQRGEAANLAAFDSVLYVTRGEDGLAVLDGRSGKELALLAPATGTESVDDVSVDGTLLFVLDATPPGHVAVYSLSEPGRPRLVSGPYDVAVGPFSGVSARGGLAVVSGGTSSLSAWRYDAAGTLTGPTATTDLGRGQPDVLVAPDGSHAYVSTHYWGPYFGLDVLRYDSASRALTLLAELRLEGAGFTEGGAKPANFPIDAEWLGRDTVLVAHARGVAVVSTKQPGTPGIAQVISVGGRAVNIDVRERMAVISVAGPTPSLVLLDFSAPSARVIRRIELPRGTFPTGVAFTATRVAVAARERGVLLFDP
jgi:hypothetical protein